MWPALSIDATSALKLIKTCGAGIDKEIARFRLAAIEGTIPNNTYAAYSETNLYELKMRSLSNKLNLLLGKKLTELALSILEEKIEPYREIAKSTDYREFIDFIMDHNYSKQIMDKISLDEEWRNLQMNTIKKKGARKTD
ncbi:MAG: hypothetical protein V4536_02000 [Pseudomonadota bacterium]